MLDALKSRLSAVNPAGLARFRPDLATLTKLTPVIVLAIGLTALALLYLGYDASRYEPVFGAHETVSVGDMVTVLDGAHIAYRIHPDTGQILVRDGDLGRARMMLASKGVVAKLPAGLELLDRSDPLGTSQFVEDVRFRRGLEGELATSIATLDAVRSARVHLAIGKSSSFVISDGARSTASVVLTLWPGRSLDDEQIAAIVNLVAHSVSNLDPGSVTVIDQAGDYLSSRIDAGAGFDGRGNGAAARYRQEALRNLRDLLSSSIGPGNFKASVAVEVNDEKVDETREQYGTQPKLTDEATRDEHSDASPAVGVPGSLSNRPIPPAPPSGASAASAPRAGTTRNAATRQYRYDRDIVQIRRRGGQVKRLSVAVVLNDAASPTRGKPWSAGDIARVEKIVRSGLGIDATRGDSLVVSSLAFTTPIPVPWWKQRELWVSLAPYAGYVLGAVLLLVFVVRPLRRFAKVWLGQLPARTKAIEAERATAGEPISSLGTAQALPPLGSSIDVMVGHLRTLAANEPERVAEVVKQWIQKHD